MHTHTRTIVQRGSTQRARSSLSQHVRAHVQRARTDNTTSAPRPLRARAAHALPGAARCFPVQHQRSPPLSLIVLLDVLEVVVVARARKRGRSTSKQQAAAAAAAEHTISGADATGRHQPLATGGHGAHLGIAGEPKLEIFGFWSAWQPRRRQQREPREGDTGPGPGPGPWPAAGPGPIENGKGQGSWLRAYEARQGPSCMWGPAD